MTGFSTPTQAQKGSALFIILIGIALFAALSFVVAQMMRGGDPSTISNEKAKLYANEILDYARSLREAVQSARISGCDDTDISFDNTHVTGYAHTPAAPSECEMFSTSGLSRSWVVPSAQWLDASQSGASEYGEWLIPANICVPDIGTGGTGCESDGQDGEDLVLILPYISESICAAINYDLGRGSAIPVETGSAWDGAGGFFDGHYSDGVALDQAGLMSGCFEGSTGNTPGPGTYNFFQVLLPR